MANTTNFRMLFILYRDTCVLIRLEKKLKEWLAHEYLQRAVSKI